METINTRLGDVEISHNTHQRYKDEIYRVFSEIAPEIQGHEMELDIPGLIDVKLNKILELDFESTIKYIERQNLPIPKSIRTLIAHGESWDDDGGVGYMYMDVDCEGLKIAYNVQDWVDRYDGRYDALYVQTCNPAAIELQARRSLLIYPTSLNTSKEIMRASEGNGNGVLKIKAPPKYFTRHLVRRLTSFLN